MTIDDFQWVLSFVEMGLRISEKCKMKSLLISMIAEDYNTLHTSNETRIKETKENMELNIEADEVDIDVWAHSNEKALSVKGNKAKFGIYEDTGVYNYLAEVESLIILAEQHRQLPVVKLKKADFYHNSNKLARKKSSNLLFF